ncbi:MAG: hypothetical protein OEV42_05205 [Deltaproteobacteria bacterium]|nr:hypothetical protein [Deltaproteobacteria bacterium]
MRGILTLRIEYYQIPLQIITSPLLDKEGIKGWLFNVFLKFRVLNPGSSIFIKRTNKMPIFIALGLSLTAMPLAPLF